MTDVTQRAQQTKALLADPLLLEAFDVVTSYHTAVFADRVSTAEQLMEAHLMVRALRDVKAQLHTVIVDGQLFDQREKKKRAGP